MKGIMKKTAEEANSMEMSVYFAGTKYVDRSWEYIKSLTDT
jgi:hypothetical protein